MRPETPWGVPDAAPAPAATPRTRRRLPVLNLLLFVATLITTTMAGARNADVPIAQLHVDWAQGLPFSITLMAILLAHEMGHYVVARIHGVEATAPFFLPGPPLPPLPGTLGAFIRMRTPPRDRRVLFDVGAAGPWAGLLVAVPAVLYGLANSELRPIPPSFSGIYFGDSLLFKSLSWIAFGPIPYGFDIILHPVALAGWFGLFVTVLNLLPVGQLDGGHVVYAMFGRNHWGIARSFLVMIVGMGFLGWTGWFVWAVLLMFIGIDHPPTVDRDRQLDRLRLALGWLTLLILVLTFIPVPILPIEGGSGPLPEELVPV